MAPRKVNFLAKNVIFFFNALGRLKPPIIEMRNNGAQGRDRTTDTRIFSPLLYQLSYLGDVTRKTRQGLGLYVINSALSRCAAAPETGGGQDRETLRIRLNIGQMTRLVVLLREGFKSSLKGLFFSCCLICASSSNHIYKHYFL